MNELPDASQLQNNNNKNEPIIVGEDQPGEKEDKKEQVAPQRRCEGRRPSTDVTSPEQSPQGRTALPAGENQMRRENLAPHSPGVSLINPAALQEVDSETRPDGTSDLEASNIDLIDAIEGRWGNDHSEDCFPERIRPEGAATTWNNKLLSELFALSKVVENVYKAGEYLERVVARRIERARDEFIDMTGAPTLISFYLMLMSPLRLLSGL